MGPDKAGRALGQIDSTTSETEPNIRLSDLKPTVTEGLTMENA